MDIFTVEITQQARRDLRKVPVHILRKLHSWIDSISYQGLRVVRKLPGYHDEPLYGKRLGERSIRLSKSYRAIYTISQVGLIEIIKILEVSKHGY